MSSGLETSIKLVSILDRVFHLLSHPFITFQHHIVPIVFLQTSFVAAVVVVVADIVVFKTKQKQLDSKFQADFMR